MSKIVNIPAKASRGKRAILQMVDDICDEQYKEFFDKIDGNIGIVDIREVVNEENNDDN